MRNTIKTSLGKIVNYATCVVLMPFVIMIYQYQVNIQYLSLVQVLLLCCFLAVAFLALYFIVKAITKSELGAFLSSFIACFSFFTYHDINFVILLIPRANRTLQVFLLYLSFFLLAVAIVLLCRRYRDKLKSKKITMVVLVMLCAIIAQNVALIVLYDSQQQVDERFYKEDFNITQTLEEQPNIYWIHTDGMLGFDSMSRFFGDDQEEFASALESRGFWINREATLVANRSTYWAVPSLMSPFYYDRVLSWTFDPEYAESIPQNEDLLNDPSLRLTANDASNNMARQKNETIMAFGTAGFSTYTISNICKLFYPTVDRFYTEDHVLISTQPISDSETFSQSDSLLDFENLVKLFLDLTPIPESSKALIDTKSVFEKIASERYSLAAIENKVDLFSEWEPDDERRPNLTNYSTQANSLYDTLTLSGPRFTLYNFLLPHLPFCFDEDGYGYYNAADVQNPMRYPAHHTFTANTLLKFVDMILEHDPNAVIVLQADHGLHGLPESKFWGMEKTLESFSCTPEEAVGLWNQVMSAVRLPGEQLTPETEQILSDPRNISRYLINTYVGENYDYIPNQYRQRLKALYNGGNQTAD